MRRGPRARPDEMIGKPNEVRASGRGRLSGRRSALMTLVGALPSLALACGGAERRSARLIADEGLRFDPALGDVSGLSPAMLVALADGDHFEPMPSPESGDWLAEHPDEGQTFDQFVRSDPTPPSARRKTIYVQPIGAFVDSGSPTLALLEAWIRAYFGLDVARAPTLAVDELDVQTREGSLARQLLTRDVLDALAARLPDDAFCTIGVTMEDLYPGDTWNYVFGFSSRTQRVGIHSFARFDPHFFGSPREPDSEAMILRRSLRVASHELGHVFGLRHCIHYRCGMNGLNSLEEGDAQPLELCPVCLRKLHFVTALDPGQRYAEIAAFYAGLELDEAGRRVLGPDIEWIAARRRTIDALA